MTILVNEYHEDIANLRLQWIMLDALKGGTYFMRLQKQYLLPQWPAESDEAYVARLRTATLFPAFTRTADVMSGKPFSKSLDLKDAPPAMEEYAEDIDLQGVSLHSFAAEMFREVMHFGMAGILVEYPKTGVDGSTDYTKADVESSGARPYFVRIMHNQILGWKSQVVNGKIKLTQLRILETTERDDGLYGTIRVEQVRVLFPGGYQIQQMTSDGSGWEITEQGSTTLADIPFVPLYGDRVSFMVGSPPLLDLAYLNVKHWQSQSDQDTILHVARVPILAMIGADDDSALTLGGSTAVRMPQGAELKYVEHSGKAIEAGAAALDALEQQMIQTGAELLVKQVGGRKTATESQTDAEANKSDLQRMAETFEDAFDQALWFMAQYIGAADGGKVSLYADYGVATLSEASAVLIQGLQLAGIISKVTAIEELQRRGVLSNDIDPEVEIAAVEAEGPDLGVMPAPPTTGSDMSTSPNVGG